MDEKWKETFLLHSQIEEFRQKISEAEKIIAEALRKYRKPYIAFSGGKDSTVMMHMVLKRKPDIQTYHFDFGRLYIPETTHNEILNNAEKIGAHLNVLLCDDQKLFSKELKEFSSLLYDLGYDSVFVGLRKEESSWRRLRIKKNIFLTKINEIYPVANWSWLDVWGYIVNHGLPYLSHYDLYSEVLGWDRARFSLYFDPMLDKFGCSNIDGMLTWKFTNILEEVEDG